MSIFRSCFHLALGLLLNGPLNQGKLRLIKEIFGMEKIGRKIGYDVWTFEPNAEYKGATFHRIQRRITGKWERQQQITIPIDDERLVGDFLGCVADMIADTETLGEPEDERLGEASEEELSGPWEEEKYDPGPDFPEEGEDDVLF
jgi:hypothetical protein